MSFSCRCGDEICFNSGSICPDTETLVCFLFQALLAFHWEGLQEAPAELPLQINCCPFSSLIVPTWTKSYRPPQPEWGPLPAAVGCCDQEMRFARSLRGKCFLRHQQ